MAGKRPSPPRPDRMRRIGGSFSWIDHRFLREGFEEGLTRLEQLLYFVLIAVSNQDGVSFYSDPRLQELLEIRYPHELSGARDELVARDLIAFQEGIYQVLELPPRPLAPGRYKSSANVGSSPARPLRPGSHRQSRQLRHSPSHTDWKSLRQLLALEEPEESDE